MGFRLFDGERVTRAGSVRKRNVTDPDNGNNNNKKKNPTKVKRETAETVSEKERY